MVMIDCGPGPVTTADDSSGGGSDGSGESSGSTPTGSGEVPVWSDQPDGCGALYGVVVLGDGDVVAVGGLVEPIMGLAQPWAVRFTAEGEAVWLEVLGAAALVGVLAAVERVGDDVIAVGYHLPSQSPLLVRLAVADGSIVWDSGGAPGDGGLYGAAWSSADQTLWVTGSAGDQLLVARYSGDGERVATLAPPDGATVGYAAAVVDGGVIVCGRAAALEGGRLWLGRYSSAGDSLWTTLGPDPGVGAFSDCWDVAASPDGMSVTVEAGYTGSRVAQVDGEGALMWEFAEGNAGAEAVDVAGGQVVVAGWSASMNAMPLRSHTMGERDGWVRRFTADGEGPVHTWVGADRFSPRDVKVHGGGGVVIAGQRLPEEGCAVPWLGRVDG